MFSISGLLDPAGVFGGPGLFGGEPGGQAAPAPQAAPAQQWTPGPTPEERIRPFLAGIAPPAKLAAFNPDHQMAPPPPPQWAYVNGQGPVWQTPGRRLDANNNYEMVNNAPGTPGFYGGGNRI